MERVYIILNASQLLRAFGVTFFFITVCTTGCSTPSLYERMEAKQADARPSRDTNFADMFYGGQQPMPERPVRQWDFFYKDCELARRSLRPNRSEWECSRP